MTGAPRQTTRARYAARRDAILSAACKVFIDQGVSGFTLTAVAKGMDLHPVSLTHYFKRKEDLAAECMRLT
ncbi:MAG TPA: helix-turn-helix domain-containing protein, partial [Phenylobacterium sp.]|nr:helix-turn-helix domain-containing protein [Phenylobacterium sp.]